MTIREELISCIEESEKLISEISALCEQLKINYPPQIRFRLAELFERDMSKVGRLEQKLRVLGELAERENII